MTFTLIFFALVLTISFVLLPWQRAQKRRQQSDFDQFFELFKLRKVREHYQPLQRLSYTDIIRHYNVDDAYYRLYRK